ncbi:MAG: hypothetical protein ACE5IJ_08910 [Thermoplasmata archaeon]
MARQADTNGVAVGRWHYVIVGYLIFYGTFYLVALLLGLAPGWDISRFTVWTVLLWMQPLLIVIGAYYIMAVRKKAGHGPRITAVGD